MSFGKSIGALIYAQRGSNAQQSTNKQTWIGGCAEAHWECTMPPETHSNDFGFFFFGINWKIRIRFSSWRKIFERFEFLVCSKFNHMQRDCTCACAVACLHPRNFIPNVVVSVTIHDVIKKHIFIYMQRTWWSSDTDV